MNRTVEAMDTIGMKDVPSSLYNGLRVDDARDSLSCAVHFSFDDDVNNFSCQELDATKQNDHDLMSHPDDAFIALQDLYATKKMDHDLIQGRHLTRIPVGVPCQDIDAMDRMDHDTMRPPDLIPAFIEILPGTSIIDEDDDMSVDHGEVVRSLKQEDLHITASNIRQMILDIRSSSPLAFINQCTHSLRTANKLVATNAGAIDAPASQGANEWPTTSYDVAQPSAVFMTKVSQQHSIKSSLRPGVAMTPSTTIPSRPNNFTPRQLSTHCDATRSYCEESHAPGLSPPLIIHPKPKKKVEDAIPGFDITKFRPMPFRAVD